MGLVEQLRRMTGVGAEQYEIDGVTFWSDEALEQELERHVSARLIQSAIDLFPTRTPSGGLTFATGRTPVSGTLDVESVVVVAFSGGNIPGDATVHGDGRIEFTEDQVSSIPVISGLCYDLNAAAAEVMGGWASAVSDGFDVTIDGQSIKRSQRADGLLKQAEAFRTKAVAGSVQVGRSDLRPHRGGGQRIGAALKAFDRLGHPG